MPISATSRQATIVRPITQVDVRQIMRMIDSEWRVFLRLRPAELGTKFKELWGVLAEDKVGLRGFLLIDPQTPEMVQLIAAGLRDTWSVTPYLDLLLPAIEQVIRAHNLRQLIFVGNAPWLVEELWRRGFKTREWIIVLERPGGELPVVPPTPAQLRPTQRNDLLSLVTLDTLAFDQIWHKSAGNFTEALSKNNSFMLAELEGQLVGYEWCEIHLPRAHLNRLAVHPDYQGRGIGAQLLQQAITDALASGATKITLNTQENNHRSRALYQRFGFVVTNQRMPALVKTLT
jgi:ribosomal protein S18 acetylase RimI-like enzyme